MADGQKRAGKKRLTEDRSAGKSLPAALGGYMLINRLIPAFLKRSVWQISVKLTHRGLLQRRQ
jgi:hypothetical protein